MTTPCFVVLIALAQLVKGLGGQCIFPEFLRTPMSDGSDRVWLTETKYVDNTNLWDTQLEITVFEYEVVARLKYKAQCHHPTGTVPCFQRENSYRRVCMRREDGGKYRVQHRDNGRAYYLCLKFVPRNKNIVQVWASPPREENVNELCSEHLMEREDWPWLAPALEEWAYSPIVGGFDFTTFMYERRQKLCHKVWRPSHLETECVRGEGIRFSFPEKACSPFMNHREELHLQVWGSWVEDDFLYIVTSEDNEMPHFVLRFPRDPKMKNEMSVDLFFSPVCPNERRRTTLLQDVRHAELRMKEGGDDLDIGMFFNAGFGEVHAISFQIAIRGRRDICEPGICYDESDLCPKHAQDGKCTNSALHEYANYCKRSCGLCKLLPSPRPECRFSGDIRKEWYLFETDREERVRIHGGHIVFSTLGEFVCKTKHWVDAHYKLLSYYSNGCRPRYTCINFKNQGGGSVSTLQIRISKSERSDRSFDLCHFEDDPQPLGGLIRSSKYKTLLLGSMTTHTDCGLRGTIAVNASLSGGQHCSGTLSDWDTAICAIRPRLQLSLYNCRHRAHYVREFNCIAYVDMEEGLSFLITQESGNEKYNCWIVRTYPERMSYKPWKEAYKLERAQCGTEEDHDPGVHHDSELYIKVHNDQVQRPCAKETPAPSPSTKPLNKEIRATETERKDQSSKQYLGSSAPRTLVTRLLVCLAWVVSLAVSRHRCSMNCYVAS